MKIIYFLNYIGLLLISIINPLLSVNTCPEKCSCREVPQKDKLVWTKLRCGDTEKIKHLDELDLLNIANEIVNLNLSDNSLTNFSPKIQFLALQRLDLSKNKIEALQNKQFEEVPNLRRLDISNNLIKIVEPQAFAGLKYLERLKLNQNLISTIQKGTFKTLTFLKQLDISNNPLTCDCELLWLLEWTQKQSVKIVSNPKCSSPATFKGVPLRKLKIGTDIHCKSPAGDKEIPMIDLHLRNDQILFEGDSFRLKCISPFIPDTYHSETVTKSDLLWFWQSSQKDVIRSFHTNNYFYSEKGLIESEIVIPKINQNYSGLLYCQRSTEEGNFTKAINLIIISKNSKFCDTTSTITNKGNYYWPKTLINNTVYLPCEFIQINTKASEQQASYYCSSKGKWENLNTSNCTYTSDTTRTMEQFSKLNLSLNVNIYETARHFRNFTSNFRSLKDVMDLVFLVRTIENYIPYLSNDKELGNILMDIINLLMTLPENYLRKANEVDESLDKIVKAIEDIVSHNNTSSLHKNNIVAEEFSIKKEAFVGMTCSWYSSSVNNSDRMFYCVTSSPTVTTGILNRKIDASVQIPASLFIQLKDQEEVEEDVERLLVIMMANGKLFSLDESLKGSKAITLPVVGVKLANSTAATNLTEPIYVMLRIPTTYYDATASIPVWWDPEANGGQGNWTSEGCQFSHEIRENLIFSCKSLGYYAFLEDVTKYNVIETGAKFKLSHPAIYVGSFVLFSCLLVTITTYAFCYVSIQMPKKAKHSLINLWIVIMMLVYIYVFGIYQTEDTFLCQIVGIVLHYLTLSSLLWVVVGASTMYRRLNKSDVIDLNEDELPSDQPIQKPILGLYLVGWGVALIVCGISSAVNMKEYAAYDFCFLNSPPALSALFIPTVILYALLGILFLLIRCTIYNADVNGHLSEGTQATENVDLDLLEPSFQNNDRHSILSVKTRSSEIEDQEHSPSAQLKAQVIFLLIYTIAWLCCAFATSTPFHLEHEAEIFSILYSIFASLLGVFTFFFYCVARSDIRSRWLSCKRNKTAYFRTRNVSDTSQNIQIQSLPLPSVSNQNGEAQVTSRSSSRSSTKTKSNSNNSNLLKAVTNVKAAAKFEEAPSADKINNMNLVLLHTQQYRIGIPVPNIIENPASSVQMFYNPYQSTVARKFFRKQRQHMMKRNNFPVRKCGSDTTSVISVPKSNNDAEQNIFGTSSKVNNKNIHVERIKRIKHRNPNIYSDSCEDLSLPLDKMTINSERIRRREYPRHRAKKKQNIARSKEELEMPDMRTVSQQCSLEYTSDTSALDVTQMPMDTFELPQTVDEDKHSSSPSKSVELKVTFPVTNFKRPHSRASSFSASELDELYQQIRRGKGSAKVKQKGHLRCHSPWLSDSEIHSYADEEVRKPRTIYSLDEFDDNVETTV